MNLFTRAVFALLLLATTSLQAQDIHFSMFYASPLNLNPALTGSNEGTYRAAGIYRNQWRSISVPFQTYSASFDIKLLQNKLKRDIFGVGAMFVGDKSGDGKLTMNSFMFSVAFHKGLDKGRRHFIGLGVQAGYTQKSLKYQQLLFPSQFINDDFDPSQSNNEFFTKPNIGYFDMQAGLLYQGTVAKDILGIMAGGTVYHLTMPKQTFLGETGEKLSMRFAGHLGFRIKAYKNFYITPNAIVQGQNKAKEINFGTAFEYHMQAGKSELIPSIGGWYRVGDAAIISVGLEYYKLRALFAYDINTSRLRPATNGRGAFEIALIYTGLIKTNSITAPILVPCPRM